MGDTGDYYECPEGSELKECVTEGETVVLRERVMTTCGASI